MRRAVPLAVEVFQVPKHLSLIYISTRIALTHAVLPNSSSASRIDPLKLSGKTTKFDCEASFLHVFFFISMEIKPRLEETV
jgi:hypothetical protein